MRKIDFDKPLLLTGLTGHFTGDTYMEVDSIELADNGKHIKFHGKQYQIMQGGEAKFRGQGYFHGKIKIGNFTKY